MPKLLIVDDEMDVREFAKNFFKRRGIEVWTAANAEECFELIKEEKPDLIILDLRLEGMNGLEILAKIRSSGNNTDVIMVTGVDSEDTIGKARELGVVDYIHKPLVLEELEKIVLSRLGAFGNMG